MGVCRRGVDRGGRVEVVGGGVGGVFPMATPVRLSPAPVPRRFLRPMTFPTPFPGPRSPPPSARPSCRWCCQTQTTSSPAARQTRPWPSAPTGWQPPMPREGPRAGKPPPCRRSGMGLVALGCAPVSVSVRVGDRRARRMNLHTGILAPVPTRPPPYSAVGWQLLVLPSIHRPQ